MSAFAANCCQGLFAPRNATAIVVLLFGALSLSASIFLIGELNDPLRGFITISSAPMYKALAFLGKLSAAQTKKFSQQRLMAAWGWNTKLTRLND